jgi:hypothetical protein
MDTLVTTAYELEAHRFLRRRLVFDTLATTRVTRQSHNGAVIQLNLVDDLDDTVATATLVEYYDVLPTPLHSYKTAVILNEYGRVVTSTSLFRGTTMVPFDPIAAERVGRNAGATIDKLAQSVLLPPAGSPTPGPLVAPRPWSPPAPPASRRTRCGPGSSTSDNNVEPHADGLYRRSCLRPTRPPSRRGRRGGLRTGRSTRTLVAARRHPQRHDRRLRGFSLEISTGVGATGCIMVGNDAMVKGSSNAPGFADTPSVVVSPVVDRLRRFASLGWYWLGGYARFRAEAVCTGDLAF